MPEVARLQIVVESDTGRAQVGLRQLENSTGNFVNRAGATLVGFLTRDLIRGTMAAVAGLFSVGMAYEDATNMFEAASGASAAQMERMRETARALGRDLDLPKTSAADAANAMTELAKGGLGVQQSIDAARGSLLLAAAANMDEARSAEIVVNALNAYKMSGREAAGVADLLAAASVAASGEVEDMAYALNYAAGTAARTGIPIRDTVTAIALLAKAGVQGSYGGTSFRQMLLRLQAPTMKTSALLKELNIEVYNSEGRFVGVRSLIEQFTDRLGGASQAVRDNAVATIFGARAAQTANFVLLQGTAAWDSMYEAVGRTNAAQELAAARNKGLRGAIDAVRSILEEVAISVTTAVNPSLRDFALWIGRGILAARDMAGEIANRVAPFFRVMWMAVQDVAKAIGAVIQAAGPLLSIFAQIAGGAILAFLTAIAAILGSVARLIHENQAVASLLAGALAAIALSRAVEYLNGMRALLPTLIAAMQGTVGGALGMVAAFGKLMVIGAILGGITLALNSASNRWSESASKARRATDEFASGFPDLGSRVDALRSRVRHYADEVDNLSSREQRAYEVRQGFLGQVSKTIDGILGESNALKEARAAHDNLKASKEALKLAESELRAEEARAEEERKAALLQLESMGAHATAARLEQARANGEAISEEMKAIQDFRDEVTKSYNTATSVVEAFGSQTEVTAAQVLKFFKDQVTAAQEWSSNMKELARSGIDEGLIAELATAGPKAAPLVKALLEAVRSGNTDTINQARSDLDEILQNTLTEINGERGNFQDAGRNVGQGVADGLNDKRGDAVQAGRNVGDAGADGARETRENARSAGNSIGDMIAQGVGNAVSAAAEAGRRVGNAAANAARSIWSGITEQISRHVPGFAAGGIVRTPTLAWVGEKAPEAVVPLDDPNRAWNILKQAGLTDMLAGRIGQLVGGAGRTSFQPTGDGRGGTLTIGHLSFELTFEGPQDEESVRAGVRAGGDDFLEELTKIIRGM